MSVGRKYRYLLTLVLPMLLGSGLSAERPDSIDGPLPPPVGLSVGPLLMDPLGFADREIQFSWQLPAGGGLVQRAYQIICASTESRLEAGPDLWESGWVESNQSLYVNYEGKRLDSRDQVYWKVRYKDAMGNLSRWGDPGWLEMALLEESDWKAEWIYLDEDEPTESYPAPYFRNEFKVEEGPIARARIYVSARGIFELEINGKRVGDDFFQPEWTDYSKRSLFVAYDVTELIENGRNAIGAVLGEMWYTGVLGFSTQKNKYGEIPQLLLQLEITYDDGSRLTVATDSTWRATRGPIVYSNIYHGERYDARLELGNWSEPGYDETTWKEVTAGGRTSDVAISPRPNQPIRVVDELRPVSMTQLDEDTYVFDLGQNISGWARIRVPGEPDRQYTLRFAEMLKDDGTLYTENYRAAESTDTYTCADGGEIVWEPRFTFHGFRYIELSGVPREAEPNLGWITGVALHNDMPEIGRFTSSSPMLNQLQSNIRWGQKGNFFAVPSDCPQRDERMGWTGDAQVFCSTANFNFNTLAFFVKWTQDLRDSQFASGAIPYYAPSFPSRPEKTSSGWGDAAVIVPWEVYRSFGYKRILKDNYQMMCDWVRCYNEHPETDEKLIHHGFSFGDWLQPYSRMGDSRYGETDTALIGTAYFAHCADLVSQVAEVLGNDRDTVYYRDLFERIRQAFAREFFDPDGRLTTEFETQAGYLLALKFGLLDEELANQATAHLVRHIREVADGHLRTGFLGTPLITSVLSENGYASLAYDVLFRTSYPGWFYSVDQGATTMWERWNSYSREDGFGDAKMNSFNHYAYGAVGNWIYQTAGGIVAEAPGYRVMRFQPMLDDALSSACADLETPYGMASSSWERTGDKVIYSFTVPANASGAFVTEEKVWRLQPGVHEFVRGNGGTIEKFQ